jgi:site-specific DNA-methyltransferase (adenine-specific)
MRPATSDNAKCGTFFTADDDPLAKDWGRETVWLNPPYSSVGKWVEKAWWASRNGATVICLVPARTDTRWWHSWAARAEVRFLRGRVRFGDAKSGAPFPSAILVFTTLAA